MTGHSPLRQLLASPIPGRRLQGQPPEQFLCVLDMDGSSTLVQGVLFPFLCACWRECVGDWVLVCPSSLPFGRVQQLSFYRPASGNRVGNHVRDQRYAAANYGVLSNFLLHCFLDSFISSIKANHG